MSSPEGGLDAKLYLNGSAVAQLAGLSFSWDRAYKEWAQMGTEVVTDVLLGVKKFKGGYKKAYVNKTYIDLFVNGTECTGSLLPVSGGTVVGTLVMTGGSFQNMAMEETAAVIEEGTFVMYSVTIT